MKEQQTDLSQPISKSDARWLVGALLGFVLVITPLMLDAAHRMGDLADRLTADAAARKADIDVWRELNASTCPPQPPLASDAMSNLLAS